MYVCIHLSGLGPIISRLSNSVAAGMMLAASTGLLQEGIQDNSLICLVGAVLGILFLWASQGFLEAHEDLKFGGLSGTSARKALLFVVVMTMHSFSEGIGMYVYIYIYI